MSNLFRKHSFEINTSGYWTTLKLLKMTVSALITDCLSIKGLHGPLRFQFSLDQMI